MAKKKKVIEFEAVEEVNVFIRPAPNWLIRWGSTMLGLFVVVFLCFSWLIKYPDLIQSEVTFFSDTPPVRLFSRTSGKVMNIFVEDGAAVRANELLAELQSDAELNHIIQLEHLIQEVEKNLDQNNPIPIELTDTLILVGNLQSTYASIAQQWEEFIYFSQMTIKANLQKTNALEDQKKYYDSLIHISQRQKELIKDEMAIYKFDQERNTELYEFGAVSIRDAEQSDLSFLQQQKQYEGEKANTFNLKLNKQQVDLEMLNLDQLTADEFKRKKIRLKENILQMKSEISTWKKTFLVTAPIDGIISSTKILRQFQFVPANEEIFTIVSAKSQDLKIICKGTIPISRSGKIRKGMKTIIRLENFPYEEYGAIIGTLSQISPVPENGLYHIKVSIEYPIRTNYGQDLKFKEELKGTAEIITDDKRLIERIFENFRKLIA